MGMRLGYNTNGLAHHRLPDALELLAEIGYQGVALTPDVGGLDLYHLRPGEAQSIARQARELGLQLVVETGARYLLDPRRKHRPSLLEDAASERQRRVDFLRRSIDLAQELEAPLVSIWAGLGPHGERADGPDPVPEALWERLVEGLVVVLDHAKAAGVQLSFEPEPGMFVERPCGYLELRRRLGHRGPELGLTLDVGHLLVTGDLPVPDQIRALAACLVHVHLDDIRGGVHEHRALGEGDLDLRGTLNAFQEIGYGGMLALELSRDSYRGAQLAQASWLQLQAMLTRP
jgi:L-ribulose-5-phosphate 3-epimerase